MACLPPPRRSMSVTFASPHVVLPELLDDAEAEIKLGILSQAPAGLVPGYELWVKRREPWLRPIEGAAQYEENRR